jgi:cellulose biosynthesis protein BcsQ
VIAFGPVAPKESQWLRFGNGVEDLADRDWDVVLVDESYPEALAVIRQCQARCLRCLIVVDRCCGPALPGALDFGSRVLFRPVSPPAVHAALTGGFRRPKVVVFGSEFGKSGKTTMSSTTAITAAYRFGARTLLIENAVEGPLLRHRLFPRMHFRKGLYELAHASRARNVPVAQVLSEYVVSLPRRGAQRAPDLLLAPLFPEQWDARWEDEDLLSHRFYSELFAAAREAYDLVVVDTSQQLALRPNRMSYAAADLLVLTIVAQDDIYEFASYLPRVISALGNGVDTGTGWVRLCVNQIEGAWQEYVEQARQLPITAIAGIPRGAHEFKEAAARQEVPAMKATKPELDSQRESTLMRAFYELAQRVCQFVLAPSVHSPGERD